MRSEQDSETKQEPRQLESGNIYFLYRPKVDRESVESLEDIQRFYIVLEPNGREWFRLIAIGKKYLPPASDGGQQEWCFVESVGDSGKALEEGLRQETYETKTRGRRTQPAARPVGEGVYKLVLIEGQTRLLYALELPSQLGDAQSTFNIAETGNYVISIKNPEKSTPPNAGFRQGDRKADFPQRLQNKFDDRRFIPADPADFLDYPNAEFILISTDSDSAEEVGVDLTPKEENESNAEMINNLRMRKTRHPLEPLLEGRLK